MKLYSEIITQFTGQTVSTYIYHKLYGTQKLKLRKFQPLYEEDRIGFIVGEHEIFVYLNEVKGIEMGEKMLKINGILQDITIEII